MADELKTIKFQMMLSPSEAEAIDSWGFANRIRSRAEAIRRLTATGLALHAGSDEFFRAMNDHGARLTALAEAADKALSRLATIEADGTVSVANYDTKTLAQFALSASEINGELLDGPLDQHYALVDYVADALGEARRPKYADLSLLRRINNWLSAIFKAEESKL